MPFATEIPDRASVRAWLVENDPSTLEILWRRADEVRRANVGDAVHLRGLIEISNHCVRQCLYCGIRGCAADVIRYRMGADEILGCAREAARLGYGTVVMQSGEDPGLTAPFIADLDPAHQGRDGAGHHAQPR